MLCFAAAALSYHGSPGILESSILHSIWIYDKPSELNHVTGTGGDETRFLLEKSRHAKTKVRAEYRPRLA